MRAVETAWTEKLPVILVAAHPQKTLFLNFLFDFLKILMHNLFTSK